MCRHKPKVYKLGTPIPMPHIELSTNILLEYFNACQEAGITNPKITIPKMVELLKIVATTLTAMNDAQEWRKKARKILKESGIEI